MQFLETQGLREAHSEDIRRRWGDYYGGLDPSPLPDEAYGDNWVGRSAEDLIAGAPKDKPWFLQVNFPGPHDPWDITESMGALYQDIDFPPAICGTTSPEKQAALNKVRRNYAAMVSNIDSWTGRLLEAVAQRGELDNTIIVYASDHGEMLGDHERFIKQVPYWQSTGVPLIITGPGIAARATEMRPVSLLDVSATFLDWAGASIPDDWDSRSLRSFLDSSLDTLPREVVTSSLNNRPDQDLNWRMAFDGRFKYVENFPTGTHQLWDLEHDPSETRNLLENPKYTAIQQHLQSFLNTTEPT